MFIPEVNKLLDFARRHGRTLMPFLTLRRAWNIAQSLKNMWLRAPICNSEPFIYKIDPCSTCNLRCPSCASTLHDREIKKKRVMDLNDFEVIVDKIKVNAIRASLSDQGESFLNKNIYEMIKYARKAGISTSISTNFNVYDVDAILDSGLTLLQPCLDGFTQKAYETYRRGGSVEKVKNGIELVMAEKRRCRAKHPIVDVNVVLFDHIREELPLIEKFLKDCRVDNVTYRPELGGFNAAGTTLKPSPSGNCFWLYIGMTINPDGSVVPCCGRGFDCFTYGNILEESILEIWNNKYYQFSRKLFVKGADLPFDVDMVDIPCLHCDIFKKERRMKPESTDS